MEGKDAFLVSVKMGRHEDDLPTVIRSTEKLAQEWCQKHADRHGGSRIAWMDHGTGNWGISGTADDRMYYTIEPFPFE